MCRTRVVQQIGWASHELHVSTWYNIINRSLIHMSDALVKCTTCQLCITCYTHVVTSEWFSTNTSRCTQNTDIFRVWIISVWTIQLPHQLQPVLSSFVTVGCPFSRATNFAKRAKALFHGNYFRGLTFLWLWLILAYMLYFIERNFV